MDTSTMIMLAVVIVGAIVVLYVIFYLKDKKKNSGSAEQKNPGLNNNALQLQAYERLVLLADRIALPNIITRTGQTGISAKELQAVLVQTIRQEFEHNITQQVYVSAAAWEAIRNLKEQNILIINQISSFLPDNALAADLSRSIMDLLMENPKASLHNIVADALAFEAKKLL